MVTKRSWIEIKYLEDTLVERLNESFTSGSENFEKRAEVARRSLFKIKKVYS